MPESHNQPVPDAPGPPLIRPVEPRDLTFVRAELARNWGSAQISSLGAWHDADTLPGLIALAPDGITRIGLLTHTPMLRARPCEIITLSALVESGGVGSALLARAFADARAAGCTRAFLTTTNDNLRAIGFYQKRGMSLVAVHRDAMTVARQTNPHIPLIGMHGIPLRDELELELCLDTRA